MKKISILFLALFLVLTLSPIGASESEPLYKYKQLENGEYGYDTNAPVMYYTGSQEQIQIPVTYEQEQVQFKSSWIGTIFNLHFPQISEEQAFKDMYESRLDDFEAWNLNAMIFQVRPLLDAFYPSEINPTSEYLSGQQGKDVNFDPLAYMVDATHARGMEYHAWFNPYRVTNSDIMSAGVLEKLAKVGFTKEDVAAMTSAEKVGALHKAGVLADKNFAVKHPEFVLEFQGKLFLNPGEQEVINHVGDTIAEVVKNYDVDAIHFDDYFYPYKGGVLKDENGNNIPGSDIFGSKNEDRATFEKYGQAYPDTQEGIEAWRRDNVTRLIDKVNEVIGAHNKKTQSSVQFGISPFGIWEHKSVDDRGSNTPQGSSKSYSQTIFADTYQWIKDGKLDYVAPQIYWSFGAGAAPYGELARWWNEAVEGTQTKLYIGHANYKHVNNAWDGDWKNPEEINNQMKFNQTLHNIAGSALYGYSDIMPSNLDTVDQGKRAAHEVKNKALEILRNDSFSKPALSPSHPQLSHGNIQAVSSVEQVGSTLTWVDNKNTNARLYTVYGAKANETADQVVAKGDILGKVNFEGQKTYTFDLSTHDYDHYVVTVSDKAYVQSTPTTSQKFVFTATTNKDIELEKGSVFTKEDFIKALGIEANDTYTLSTNFDDIFDGNTLGKQTVITTLTSDKDSTTLSFETTINVVAKPVKPEEPKEEEPTPEDKEPNEEKPASEDKESKETDSKLPATGMGSNFVGYGVMAAGAAILTLVKTRKKD